MRHLLSLMDLESSELISILELAGSLKSGLHDRLRRPQLPGRVQGLLFEKPSLRTRVSFEAAMTHLGGSSIFLGKEAGWGKRESIADFGRVLSEYLDVLIFRGKDHDVLTELAMYCSCPVVNGLTDMSHPCQAIADVFTVREAFGHDSRLKVAYVGDANNVACSLVIACGLVGIHFAFSSPSGYGFSPSFMREVKEKCPNMEFTISQDPVSAVSDADAVYTDVWASMGQESEEEQRKQDFADYQVNASLLSHAKPTAIFLHCLPARRGQEVTDEVMDGPQSAIVAQAGNRMHSQKAILVWLLQQQAVCDD